MFAPSVFLSLALLPDAEAANIPKIKTVRVRQITNENSQPTYSLVAVTPDAAAEVASVAAELDGQPVSFTESNAWVHGTATLAVVPAEGAEITLTVYGAASAVLRTFAGTYTDGALLLTSTDRGDDGGGCTARVMNRTGECVEYGSTVTRDVAELDLDELDVALAWLDGGEGVSTLAVDEDPFTTAGVISDQFHNDGTVSGLLVASNGWTLGDALPEVAAVELEGGETWSIPANSYQLTAAVPLDASVDALIGVAVGGVSLTEEGSDTNQRRYVDADNRVLLLIDEDQEGTLWVSVTTWAASPDDLPTGVSPTLTDGAGDVDTDVVFDDEVAVVFAIEATVATDPAGTDLLGKGKLEGEANKHGKRETLAKGTFAGQFGMDGDGEPIDIERTSPPAGGHGPRRDAGHRCPVRADLHPDPDRGPRRPLAASWSLTSRPLADWRSAA